MRPLPLDAEHARLGARFGDVGGWKVPLHYGNPSVEQQAVRAGAGVTDGSARGKVRVTGDDRLPYLDGLLTNDVKALGDGGGLYAATLDHHGKVQGDMVVYDVGDAYLLETEQGAQGRLLAYLNKLLVSDDVTLADVTANFVLLGVFGPSSGEVVAQVFGQTPPGDPYAHEVVSYRGIPVRVAHNPYFGGPGYELWIPAEAPDASPFRALVEAGARPFGAWAAEALRIEAGRPKFGVDMDERTLALEAGLDEAISLTKGCYVGQEVVSRATHRGHMNRFLVGLELDGDAVPPAGSEVVAGGVAVGTVTSAARSESRGKVLALGYVRREHAAPGTAVTVRSERDATGRVVALPFARR